MKAISRSHAPVLSFVMVSRSLMRALAGKRLNGCYARGLKRLPGLERHWLLWRRKSRAFPEGDLPFLQSVILAGLSDEIGDRVLRINDNGRIRDRRPGGCAEIVGSLKTVIRGGARPPEDDVPAGNLRLQNWG